VAHVAASSTYLAADGSAQSFAVAKLSPTAPSISNLPAKGAIGGSFTPSVSTNGDGVKSVTSSNSVVCTVDGAGLVTFLQFGICGLVPRIATGTNYLAAAGSVQTFLVLKSATSAFISNFPAPPKVGDFFTPVILTNGDGVKSVTSSTTAVCSVNGAGLVTFLQAGTCTLTAHVAAGSEYWAADGAAQTATVARAQATAPSISNLPATGTIGGSFTPSVVTSGDGVKWVTSSTASVCTVDGTGKVDFIAAGTCTLLPRVAIGANYVGGAGSAQSFTVLKTPSLPSITNAPTAQKVGDSFTPSVATTGDGVKSVTSSTPSVCTVDGAGKVSFIAAGTCTLIDHVTAGSLYASADGNARSLAIGRGEPSALSISNLPASPKAGESFTPLVPTPSDGVTWVTSSTQNICSVNGDGLVTFLKAGTCRLTPRVASTSNYLGFVGSEQSVIVRSA
jgi:hypothetical protein